MNPPSAAWWGGSWERIIRSCKDLIKRMQGNSHLNHVQLETCLYLVEAIINERPLTFVTEDGDDLIPLTPSMFIKDLQSSEYPEAEAVGIEGMTAKYKSMKMLQHQIRDRFRKEYLGLLVQRGKERKSTPCQVGDVVLIGMMIRSDCCGQWGGFRDSIQGRTVKCVSPKSRRSMDIFSAHYNDFSP